MSVMRGLIIKIQRNELAMPTHEDSYFCTKALYVTRISVKCTTGTNLQSVVIKSRTCFTGLNLEAAFPNTLPPPPKLVILNTLS